MDDETGNKTLRQFLLERAPEYIDRVPKHWLEEHQLSNNVQICMAVLLLIICIPGNVGHVLVFTAYSR